MKQLDYFKLVRDFWDFSFENPELIKPNHCALYLFAVEHCNRLGWKPKFGFPTEMVKDAIGIKSYTTYISTLNDLVDWRFIKMIEKSKNQYSSNIIAIVYFDKALDKALDKAFIKHDVKQSESNIQSNSSIDKQDTIIQYTNLQINQILLEDESWINEIADKNKTDIINVKNFILEFNKKLKLEFDDKKTIQNYASHFSRWLPIELKKVKENKNGEQFTGKQQYRYSSAEARKTITGDN